MNELIKEIQNTLNDYWETDQERDDADYALHKIQDILAKYDYVYYDDKVHLWCTGCHHKNSKSY